MSKKCPVSERKSHTRLQPVLNFIFLLPATEMVDRLGEMLYMYSTGWGGLQADKRAVCDYKCGLTSSMSAILKSD